MAEVDQEQKTEEPTEKKRQKAREDGQVARSQDLSFAAVLLASTAALWLAGAGLLQRLDRAFANAASAAAAIGRHEDVPDPAAMAVDTLVQALLALMPVFLVAVPVALAISFLQVGLHFLPQKLRPRPEKMVPNLSPTRFVNGKSLIETLTSVLKLVVLVVAFWWAVRTPMQRMFLVGDIHLLAADSASLVLRALFIVGLALLALGGLDFLLKRRQNEKELRMTKDEVKQEQKDAMGDPEVRARIKRKQREMALKRMMDEVPQASVVVTNPTHYAVALRYEEGMNAPRCIAKGRDLVALRIREIARDAGVPVVEDPPLARALHDAVEPGDEIPAVLYQAVAELLARIFKRETAGGKR